MKLVVDTNILFSFFWENSLTKELIKSNRFELICPKKAFEEIGKYKKEIIKKTGIKEKEFDFYLKEIKKIVKIIDKREFSDFYEKAEEISPDKGDVDFLALSLKEDCPLWSNDSKLKEQKEIHVLNTEDIIDVLFD